MKSVEGGFAEFQRRNPPTPGRTLVVGSKVYGGKLDRRTLYPRAVGVDLFGGEGVDVVADLELPQTDLGMFDHIDLCSVLEHVRRPWKMAETLEGLLRAGGTILVSVPFVWRIHAYPSDYWRMTPEALEILFPNVRWADMAFVVGESLVQKVPSIRGESHPWMGRAEVAAFGVRCA